MLNIQIVGITIVCVRRVKSENNRVGSDMMKVKTLKF